MSDQAGSAGATRHEPEYVLGTGRDELERLGHQHRLWSDAAHEAWLRAGIGAGARVLDAGCGPGYAAFDLAQLVTGSGSVVGVDESAGFVGYLNEQASRRGLGNLRGIAGDAQRLGAALAQGGQAEPFDAVWTRWVLCFVPDPEAMVAGMGACLRAGGRLVVHDYFNYRSMAMAPRTRSWERVVEATMASWRSRGGDPDVMGRVPALCHKHGLRVRHMRVIQRMARWGEPMWHWPDQWWRTFAPKLVAMGFLAQAECDELIGDLDEARRTPGSFLVPPPVYEMIAEKP